MIKINLFFLLLIITQSSLICKWRQTSESDLGDLQVIKCLDSNNCYAFMNATYDWRLYKSFDQGKTWEFVYKSKEFMDQYINDPPAIIRLVDAISPDTNYFFMLSDDYTVIEKSTDGGRTFKKIILDADSHYPRNIAMYDTSIGIALNTNSIYTTTDGWETFVRHPKLNTNQSYYSPVFLDSNTVGMIYGSPWANSFGKGESFVKYYLNEDRWDTLFYFQKEPNIWVDIIYGIYFVNDTLGFGCGRQINDSLDNGQYIDIIYKTTDGGKNWELIHKEYKYPYKGFYNNISFTDEKNGVAVGYWGKIAMTNDGGETWVYEPTPNAMDNCLKMLVCWAGRTPLIGTWDAGIFRYEGDFFKFPDTTDVEEIPKRNEISIYPNPASDYLYLKNAEPIDKIKILSALGIIVLECENQDKIDVSSLSPGLYFIKEGNTIKKFIKY